MDDTLFQTARKCPGGVADGLRLMSRLNDGSPSGYATVRQESLLKWLRVGKLIPVTARSREALSRADIEQAPAICGNGGCILLDDGEIDQAWHDQLLAQARDGEAVDDVYAALTGALDTAAFRHWVAAENGMPQFIVVKSNRDGGEVLADIERDLVHRLPDGWRVHRNDNNLAYLPPWLSKRHAVRYLIEKLRADAPDAPVIGIGDSVSDVGFMDLCDFAMTPTQSQLWTHVGGDNVWID
nr:sucrose-6-phosphate hydrolase [Asticcacaulis solisilvae]